MVQRLRLEFDLAQGEDQQFELLNHRLFIQPILLNLYLCGLFPAGKTLTFARTVDIPRSAYNFRFFASSSLHHTTECNQMDHVGCLNYTIRCPVGVGESSAQRAWHSNVIVHSSALVFLGETHTVSSFLQPV